MLAGLARVAAALAPSATAGAGAQVVAAKQWQGVYVAYKAALHTAAHSRRQIQSWGSKPDAVHGWLHRMFLVSLRGQDTACECWALHVLWDLTRRHMTQRDATETPTAIGSTPIFMPYRQVQGTVSHQTAVYLL